MSIRTATYALAVAAPYLVQRGVATTLQAPIRYGSAGSLVTVTEAGSTVTITRPDGTDLVSGAAVTVSSSTAGYPLTPAASETLGEGWTVVWSLVIDSVTYTFRQSMYLCEYVPSNVISAADLYTRIPELRHRVPQAQGDTDRGGTGVGWQPQIDEAYWELMRRLIDDGRKPWLIREVTGYRDWLLVRALQLCVESIPHAADSEWAQRSKTLYFEMNKVNARFRIQYSDDAASYRRGGSPVIRLAPAGRPVW